MRQFSLVVKGPPIIAEAVAFGKGLTVLPFPKNKPRILSDGYSCFVRVPADEASYQIVQQWFLSLPAVVAPARYPVYPVGTLLHWTGIDEDRV